MVVSRAAALVRSCARGGLACELVCLLPAPRLVTRRALALPPLHGVQELAVQAVVANSSHTHTHTRSQLTNNPLMNSREREFVLRKRLQLFCYFSLLIVVSNDPPK